MILIIVLAVTMGAMFATMAWASRTQTFGRQDTESRQILFTWFKTFESVWPPAIMWPPFDPNDPIPPMPTNAFLEGHADDQIELVGGMLGVWDGSNNRAQIGAYTVTALPTADGGSGLLTVNITIMAGNRTVVGPIDKNFNIFSSVTVLDITVP